MLLHKDKIKKYIPRNERNKENSSTHANNSIIADKLTPFSSNNIRSPYSTDIWNTDYIFDFTGTKIKRVLLHSPLKISLI